MRLRSAQKAVPAEKEKLDEPIKNLVVGVEIVLQEINSFLDKHHITYKEGKFLFSANSRSKVTGNLSGMVKVYSHRDSDKILGAHIIGEHAGELIGEFVVSIEMGASAEDIALICHAHPTLSESIKEASSIASYGKTIHS